MRRASAFPPWPAGISEERAADARCGGGVRVVRAGAVCADRGHEGRGESLKRLTEVIRVGASDPEDGVRKVLKALFGEFCHKWPRCWYSYVTRTLWAASEGRRSCRWG
ncbi:MAG: hypothetical protein D6815_13010 [Candidatus Dadabacteria bacterium]|nr:MAG: hypothetical protein D6815_13010 [Candidatus Dadabacteria bacterium]